MIKYHLLNKISEKIGILPRNKKILEKEEMSLLTRLLNINIKDDPTETLRITYQVTLEELANVPAPYCSRNKRPVYMAKTKELALVVEVPADQTGGVGDPHVLR